MKANRILRGVARIVATTAFATAGLASTGLAASQPTSQPTARPTEREPWLSTPDMLAPAGPIAERIADIWWYLFVVATVVFVIVTALFLIGALSGGREAMRAKDPGDRKATPLIVGGTVVTAAILVATAIYSFVALAAIDTPPEEPEHVFEVVGKQWWWEIRYEGEAIAANEIHLPVGEPVRIRLVSDNVIHSFWVPELAGKRDLIPGDDNVIWIQADRPGVYRGECAEYCGLQHANMAFVVVAEPPDDFERWLERVRAPAEPPVTDEQRAGAALFAREGCAGCHTVRGTEARGRLGPDLTHLASRRTLGAGTLENTRGNLGGWIVNPWGVKPGAFMPPQELTGNELQLVLSYLQHLE